MSLFNTKEWWRTRCGAEETFDRHSLLATPLFGEDKKDILVVGSHDGYLRMYCPSSQWVDETKSPSNYKSTDQMIETRVGDCIVDMKTGKFVSGSQDLRLAILTSSKLLVYNAILTEESTEYGDRCELKIAYEHSLPRFPASLTVGPFGGVRGRDFLCVQCLDGTLLFYEQEVFAFGQVLRNRLLPEPIVYVSRYDLFAVASSSWFLECYRYQSMAESRKEGAERARETGESHRGFDVGNLEPDWSFNVGEPVRGIEVVTLTSFEIGIVVLGEKHLYCLKDNCAAIKYAKRLEYRPLCFRAYVIEPDGKLMVLVISDTSTLMIYEGSTLKWSAQLPFAPVAVARVQLRHLQGVTVVLSEDGRLEACYLGSEPSLFVAPPLHPRGYDYATAEQRLAELRALSKRSKESGHDRSSDASVDAELIVSVNVSPELQPRFKRSTVSSDSEEKEEAEIGQLSSCRLSIELSSYATLSDIQVCVDVCRPLFASKDFYVLSNLCERHATEIEVYVDGDLPAISSEVDVTVTYRTDAGNLRALRRTVRLPLKIILKSCPPENASAFATVIKSNEPPVSFAQLFPEFTGEQPQKQGWNALGLRYAHTGRVVTIVSGNASNRYRVQSDDGLSTTLLVHRLIDRLKERSSGTGFLAIQQNHVQLVHLRIEAHFLARREIDRITKEIGLLSTQLRNVERRMLRTVRERNDRSLADTGLPFLFEQTCRAIFALLEDLVKARAERDRTGHELRCSLKLLLLLMRSNADPDKYAALEAAIGFAPRPAEQLDWEEIADAALTVLLKSVSRKASIAETRTVSSNAITPIATNKELAKLKKRLVHAIERLDLSKGSDIAEIESTSGADHASA
ncbi:protein PTHB1 [Osmia bicornis bicornis]|uniref:protein PTHB1 n=1 Tax=Osmia bicornis bicornis TaxID=1437191 RepID=UPI001EAE99CA|nr:protein PTHB1 [Osmia bicornis bicornis]XP_046143780.1 protein PTHB1 [Osmia bicornis bicornis]